MNEKRALKAVRIARVQRARRGWLVVMAVVTVVPMVGLLAYYKWWKATPRPPSTPIVLSPAATATPATPPLVRVTQTSLTLDGVEVAKLDPSMDRVVRIDPLFDALKARPRSDGVVHLVVDQNVKAIVVRSVFKTCAYAGYPSASFVLEDGGLVTP